MFVYIARYRLAIAILCAGTQSSTSSQYYYGNYRYHSQNPWDVRSLEKSLTEMRRVDEEKRISVRQKLASNSGFTGLSTLHRLFYLYKFNVLQDLVFDSMHTLLLRIVKRHLEYYNDNGYLSSHMVERRLQVMPWTAGYINLLRNSAIAIATASYIYYI